MNKKQLTEFRSEVEKVIAQREALGESNANDRYMMFLLKNFRHLIQHSIDVYPKGQKKDGLQGRG
jgi:hypothetical protein